MSGADVPLSGAGAPDSGKGGPPPHPLAVRVGVATTAVLVIADQVTKELVEAILEPGRFVSWLGPHIGWQLIYNPGGAFGLPAPSWLFLTVTAVVFVLVVRALPRATNLTGAVAFGMLLAGALGNVIDRLVRAGDGGFGGGYVVDFVAWGSFPRFNVADSAITVGFVLLVIAMLVEERATRNEERATRNEERAIPDGERAAGDEAPPPEGPTT